MTDASHLPKRTIVISAVSSAALQEERDLRIFLPPGYNKALSYPTVYCQDGEHFFNFGRIATQAHKMILDGQLESVIVVGVDVDLALRTSEYDPEGSRFHAYCRFFAAELIPFVEANFSARQDSDSRLLAGDSLGGTVSLHLALDYPGLFRRVLALSGAFLPSTANRIKLENDLSWLQIYQLIGLQEQRVSTDRGQFDFLELNREVSRLFAQRGAHLQYIERPGTHIWGFWQKHLPEALLAFFAK